jgi:lysozyme family protein
VKEAAMKSVQEMARDIVLREGGYVNDPDDPGGMTNFGVTLGTLRRLGLDLTGDGAVDGRDIRALTPDRAAQIYMQHYFHGPRIADLPAALQATVFDMYVNAGGGAIRILQRLLNDMGFACTIDGALGPNSLRAAQLAYDAAPLHLGDAYGIARRNFYYALGDARPASRKYCRTRNGGKGGWITRAEEFIAPKYHLTTQQHRERVSKWG